MNNIDKSFNSDGVLVTPPDFTGIAIFPDLEYKILDDSLVMAIIRDPTNASSYLNNVPLREVHNIPADDEFQFDTCRMRGIDSLSDTAIYSAFLSQKIGGLKASLDSLSKPNPSPTPPSDPQPTPQE